MHVNPPEQAKGSIGVNLPQNDMAPMGVDPLQDEEDPKEVNPPATGLIWHDLSAPGFPSMRSLQWPSKDWLAGSPPAAQPPQPTLVGRGQTLWINCRLTCKISRSKPFFRLLSRVARVFLSHLTAALCEDPLATLYLTEPRIWLNVNARVALLSHTELTINPQLPFCRAALQLLVPAYVYLQDYTVPGAESGICSC